MSLTNFSCPGRRKRMWRKKQYLSAPFTTTWRWATAALSREGGADFDGQQSNPPKRSLALGRRPPIGRPARAYLGITIPMAGTTRMLRLTSLLLLLLSFTPASLGASPSPRPPNLVIIFCDDLGYNDLGCYGAKGYETPNIDRLAREGMRFTDLYVAPPVCPSSRAALLTGCYPIRIGILGALSPKSKIGLNSNEVTLAEMLRGQGYATAIYGKWHLGDAPSFLPTRHGFDDYFGLPYSNDMWPFHPVTPTNYPPLPLYENEQVVQLMPDQTQLTRGYTERAVDVHDRKED